MQKSLMQGLTKENVQAVINSYNLNPYYYPTLFPLKETSFLTWKMLEAQAGLRIAADIVSRGATIPKKTRDAIEKISGDIPKIAIAREKLEDELTEYDLLVLSTSGNPDLRALVEYWAEDTEFCWTGIAARLEWIALREISMGKVAFSSLNNAAVVTEYNVDYLIPAAQKVGVEKSLDGATDAKFLTVDIPKVLEDARKLGREYKVMFMTYETFAKIAVQEEVIRLTSSSLQNLVNQLDSPTVESVNAYMARQNAIFRGLRIVPIDQNITLEFANGDRVTGNPFESDVIMFSESMVLGNTWWKAPIDLKLQASVSIKAMRSHTLIKKYSDESPLREVTEGIANAFPAWNLSGRSTLMQVNATSWNKG